MSFIFGANADRRIVASLACAILAMGIVLPLQYGAFGKDRKSDCSRSQDCALDAVKQGEIRTLSEVLAVARDKVPGEVVKIELDREDGMWVYEIKILTPSGKRREIEINAQTLAVIKID